MNSWRLEDIPWDRFDASKVDPEILRIVKAAGLVEGNGRDYAQYLCRVFGDDPGFQALARQWGEEEVRHGIALGRWAELADSSYDHAKAAQRFSERFRVKLEASSSIRGSRAGEMVARCIVEAGTSSYYSAIADASREPLLREICRRIAADEFRHYKLFYTVLGRCLERERLGLLARLRIALGRILETEDDELPLAYHTGNDEQVAYERKRCFLEYSERAYGLYRPQHVDRAVSMILKAAGLSPKGRIGRWAKLLVWKMVCRRARVPDAAGAPLSA
jgi:hypothetical protein